MTTQFESSTLMPWFIFNDETFGFDADKFAQDLWAKGSLIIYQYDQELSALKDLIDQIIKKSYQYESVKDPPQRFQLIINGNILEIFLEREKDKNRRHPHGAGRVHKFQLCPSVPAARHFLRHRLLRPSA